MACSAKLVQVAHPSQPTGTPHLGEVQRSSSRLPSAQGSHRSVHLEVAMMWNPSVTSAEEPDGGNLHVRIWGGPGLGNRPGLLDNSSARPNSWAHTSYSARA